MSLPLLQAAPVISSIVVVLAAVLAVPLAAACPTGWTAYSDGICYRWLNIGLPWSAAEDACDSEQPGARLISIHDPELNTFLVDTVIGGAAWLGLRRANTSGDWTWTDGSEFDYSNWKSGFPSEGDYCVIIDCGENGAWCNRGCGNRYPVLCRIEDGAGAE